MVVVGVMFCCDTLDHLIETMPHLNTTVYHLCSLSSPNNHSIIIFHLEQDNTFGLKPQIVLNSLYWVHGILDSQQILLYRSPFRMWWGEKYASSMGNGQISANSVMKIWNKILWVFQKHCGIDFERIWTVLNAKMGQSFTSIEYLKKWLVSKFVFVKLIFFNWSSSCFLVFFVQYFLSHRKQGLQFSWNISIRCRETNQQKIKHLSMSTCWTGGGVRIEKGEKKE